MFRTPTLAVFVLVSLGLGSGLAQGASAQEQPPKAPDNETMMAEYMKLIQPTPYHQFLAKFAGKWRSHYKMWFAPGNPPVESETTVTSEMKMGGRYLVSYEQGETMGRPFEGMLILAYDSLKKKFLSVWFDNYGTSLLTSEGTGDPETGVISLTGRMDDPMTGRPMETRYVMKLVSPDRIEFEMYIRTPNGEEFKNMEGVSTRIGASGSGS